MYFVKTNNKIVYLVFPCIELLLEHTCLYPNPTFITAGLVEDLDTWKRQIISFKPNGRNTC